MCVCVCFCSFLFLWCGRHLRFSLTCSGQCRPLLGLVSLTNWFNAESLLSPKAGLYACVFVSVCVWERERLREKKTGFEAEWSYPTGTNHQDLPELVSLNQDWPEQNLSPPAESTQVQATRTGEAWSQLVRPWTDQNWFGGTENDLSQLEQTARTSWRQNDRSRQVVQTTRTGAARTVPGLEVKTLSQLVQATMTDWPDWSGGRMNWS